MNIAGNCPMGCKEGLLLGEDGAIWCASLLCPRPPGTVMPGRGREAGHLVVLSEDTFTIRHPLRERLDDALMACQLHEHIAALPGPLQSPGRYRVIADKITGGFRWEPLDKPPA